MCFGLLDAHATNLSCSVLLAILLKPTREAGQPDQGPCGIVNCAASAHEYTGSDVMDVLTGKGLDAESKAREESVLQKEDFEHDNSLSKF